MHLDTASPREQILVPNEFAFSGGVRRGDVLTLRLLTWATLAVSASACAGQAAPVSAFPSPSLICLLAARAEPPYFECVLHYDQDAVQGCLDLPMETQAQLDAAPMEFTKRGRQGALSCLVPTFRRSFTNGLPEARPLSALELDDGEQSYTVQLRNLYQPRQLTSASGTSLHLVPGEVAALDLHPDTDAMRHRPPVVFSPCSLERDARCSPPDTRAFETDGESQGYRLTLTVPEAEAASGFLCAHIDTTAIALLDCPSDLRCEARYDLTLFPTETTIERREGWLCLEADIVPPE